MIILDTSNRRVGVFIDVQNMYYSARNIYGSKVNFGGIVNAVVGKQKLVRAIAYTISTKTGEEKPFFDALSGMGIEVAQKELLEYDSGHKKGDWDVGITIDVVRMLDMLDVVVMVSGDGDYCALADYVKNRGRIFHVASFRESTSSKLIDVADIYTNLSADKKTFLIGTYNNRPPENRTSSVTDTFDDVIAEQMENRATATREVIKPAIVHKKWEQKKYPAKTPYISSTKPTIKPTPMAPAASITPIKTSEIPMFKHSFNKKPDSFNPTSFNPPSTKRGRGRPRKNPLQHGG